MRDAPRSETPTNHRLRYERVYPLICKVVEPFHIQGSRDVKNAPRKEQKGVSVTLQSGRYTFSYPRDRMASRIKH